MMATRDWDRFIDRAKVLVIGHDPRLQRSSTIAEYCFFANYYFDEVEDRQYSRKRALARSVFDFVSDISERRYEDRDVYITNLCNEALPPALKGRTVYIPKPKASRGLQHIREVLSKTKVDVIFAMSEQVNYWLQELGFYDSENGFCEDAEPVKEGVEKHPHYYIPSVRGSFKKICGNEYETENNYHIFPILHVKNYPLSGNFLKYQANYDKMKALVIARIITKKMGY